MSVPIPRRVAILLVLAVLALFAVIGLRRGRLVAPPPAPPPATGPAPVVPRGDLSVMGEAPDWSRLDALQETLSREDFEALLGGVFASGQGWREHWVILDREVVIRTGEAGSPEYRLRFAPPGAGKVPPRPWRAAAELGPAAEGRPLEGLHVAIDPGHIGGAWARAEERWLKVGDAPPVLEGDMTLLVATLLRPQLEALGARVSLVRDTAKPLTTLQPADLVEVARTTARPGADAVQLLRLATQLCHKTAEIRARAEHINRVLKPDLVLCLHFNADPWGDPARPVLVERSHLHLLVHGAYTDAELAFADQRFSLLSKLLTRTHEEERALAGSIATSLAAATGLPAYRYPPGSANALPVAGEPYVWARNLLANRLYQCPVVFPEPYVMNSTRDHPRLAAGDYEGLREIGGEPRPSIFREYAGALADGLARYYGAARARADR